MGYEVKLLYTWMNKDEKAELTKLANLNDWEIKLIENDSRSFLLIFHDGMLIGKFHDRGEPEDNSFGRDWAWVGGVLEEAYSLGVKDGSKITT